MTAVGREALAELCVEVRELGWLAGDLLTKYVVIVSPVAVALEPMEQLRSRERSIASEVARDGVSL